MANTLSKVKRLTLDGLDHLSLGKKAHLYRLVHAHGPGNGALLFPNGSGSRV